MAIKQLSETLINQIAAGEVIERPASAAKELIENALDAGATRIEIATAGGGKTLLRVTDNGIGMSPADLELAIRRHCTSKLNDSLADIRTLGFRGEALPSIGSVARLSITTRTAEAREGAAITVTGGRSEPARPSAAIVGTVVEVRDLFFATPARLKFMKSEKAEAAAISEVVRRMAIAFPRVRFVLSGSDRTTLEFPATGDDRLARMAQVLGRDFRDNAIEIDAEREGARLTGFAGVPTFNRGNSLQQYAFVNGRPVQDKLIMSALRAAYAETIPQGRYPIAVLSITLDPALVDVNVHPAKSDVRFRDPGLIRGLIIGAIREALTREGDRAATTGAHGLMRAFRPSSTGQASKGRRNPGVQPPRPIGRCASKRPRAVLQKHHRRPSLISPSRLRAALPPPSRRRGRPMDRRPPSRLAPPAPSFTKTISSPRPTTASSSSTSTPPMSGSSSRRCERRSTPARCPRRRCSFRRSSACRKTIATG